MDTVMDTVMAIRWVIITMAHRTDGTMDARSAGAVTAARPDCGSRAAADTTGNSCKAPPLARRRLF
ncbi:hypothetical protein A5906_15835 [Bradyrhizobium sacchari]|nr:hypothetical protein A5906_15835 [Bradyrhizobium sacchari]